jgi:hypothetical protein
MVTVCAWCEKYMGSKEPLQDPSVSHGICSACVERQTLAEAPVLVVSPARASTIPLLSTLLGGTPDVAIVVDRRATQRRTRVNGNGNGHHLLSNDERRLAERRRGSALYLV